MIWYYDPIPHSENLNNKISKECFIMGHEKFVLKVKGEDFVVMLQGEGNAKAAKDAVSKAFGGLPVNVLGFGVVDHADIDGR